VRKDREEEWCDKQDGVEVPRKAGADPDWLGRKRDSKQVPKY
jgi:hypothetical protein